MQQFGAGNRASRHGRHLEPRAGRRSWKPRVVIQGSSAFNLQVTIKNNNGQVQLHAPAHSTLAVLKDIPMKLKLSLTAIALGMASLSAQAQTEIQWWHSMGGALATVYRRYLRVMNQLREQFKESDF